MSSFNVRVYGILKDSERGILVSDEMIKEKLYTKFPGGGMEYGEGTRECLHREFNEEMRLDVEVGAHFYTTDFYQESAFREHDQIVSIYYWVHSKIKIVLPFVHYDNLTGDALKNPHADREAFRFMPFTEFSPEKLSFPIDKVVAELLVQKGFR